MDTGVQIRPFLPLQEGGITPLWQRGARGDFLKHMSSLLWTPLQACSFAMLDISKKTILKRKRIWM